MSQVTIPINTLTIGTILWAILVACYFFLTSVLRNDLQNYEKKLRDSRNSPPQAQPGRQIQIRPFDILLPPMSPQANHQEQVNFLVHPERRIATLIACQVIAKTLVAMVTPIAFITLGIQIPTDIARLLEILFPGEFLPSIALAALFGYGALVTIWWKKIRLNLGSLFEPVE